MVQYEFYSDANSTIRYTLETGSMHAVFHQLKRKDQVVLYANTNGQVTGPVPCVWTGPCMGCLVDYSGKGTHTKYSTVSVCQQQSPEFSVPTGYATDFDGVCINRGSPRREEPW